MQASFECFHKLQLGMTLQLQADGSNRSIKMSDQKSSLMWSQWSLPGADQKQMMKADSIQSVHLWSGTVLQGLR